MLAANYPLPTSVSYELDTDYVIVVEVGVAINFLPQ